MNALSKYVGHCRLLFGHIKYEEYLNTARYTKNVIYHVYREIVFSLVTKLFGECYIMTPMYKTVV